MRLCFQAELAFFQIKFCMSNFLRIIYGHTSYKRNKISRLEINIFGFKNDSEKWSGIYFEIHLAPSEIPGKLPGQFSPSGQIFLHWAAATLKWVGEFQNKNSRPLFTVILKSNMSISRLEILVHLLKEV